jgi:hypothetical protein
VDDASYPTTKTAGQRPVTVHSEPRAWFIVSLDHGHMRHILSFVRKCQFFCCPPIGWHPEDQGFAVSFLHNIRQPEQKLVPVPINAHGYSLNG